MVAERRRTIKDDDGDSDDEASENGGEGSDGSGAGQRKRVRGGGEELTEFFVKWRNLSYSEARTLPSVAYQNVLPGKH